MASKTQYYYLKIKENFTPLMAQKHIEGAEKLVEQTIRIINSDKNFRKVLFNKK